MWLLSRARYPKTAMNCECFEKRASWCQLPEKRKTVKSSSKRPKRVKSHKLTALTSGSSIEHTREIPIWKNSSTFTFPSGGSWKKPWTVALKASIVYAFSCFSSSRSQPSSLDFSLSVRSLAVQELRSCVRHRARFSWRSHKRQETATTAAKV